MNINDYYLCEYSPSRGSYRVVPIRDLLKHGAALIQRGETEDFVPFALAASEEEGRYACRCMSGALRKNSPPASCKSSRPVLISE